jgi:Omp85 superfamily domain
LLYCCLAGGLCFCASELSAAQETPPPASTPPVVEPKSPQDTAQTPSEQPTRAAEPDQKSQKTQEADTKKKKKRFRGSPLLAPLPLVSPAIGTGLVPVVAYIFPLSRNDQISPPSTVGAAGLITNNGTRAFAFGGQFFLKEDTYEITSGYGRGNLNYNLYGIGLKEGNAGVKLPLEQTGYIVFAEVVRRTIWKIFVGPRFTDGSSFLAVNATGSDLPAPPPDIGIHTALRALGLRVIRDTRPDHFYPVSGSKVEFTADFFSQALGSKYSFQHYKFNYDKYMSLSKAQVLAYDLYLCDTGGEPPFYGNCIYGASQELRGYTAGQYLDRHMYATQLEYRLSLPWRLGLAAFAGVGEVVPGPTQILRSNQLLPAAGGGPRFVLSSKYHVNLRTDFAWGKDSWTWSMGVGEAF